MDFAALKAQVRQTVHDTMSVPAVYSHPDEVGEYALRVRWHNKQALVGDLIDSGYAQTIEGVNRVIFNRAELDEKGAVLRSGGVLRVVAPQFHGASLILSSQEPVAGPVEVIWIVGNDS
jgi:redox-sensitive bicupin YhaK (pirin superfamily)